MPDDPRAVSVTVRPATADDARVLGIIAPAAYAAAYSDLWDDAAAFSRQLATFGEQAFADCLATSNSRIWIAEQHGQPVGYLTLLLDVASPVSQRTHGAEIARFYLLGPASGQGIGEQLLDAASDEARAHGSAYLWLDLMAHADWARDAYARMGFRVTGTTEMTKPVKAGLRDKLVMERDLG
jgi:GNAT superfamily N-acetyltransferase